MHRLFAGIALPELARDALTQLQSGLEGARWTAAENFHLTLQFIGETDRHGLDDVHSALLGADAPAFDLSLSGCGFFGDVRPRALWVGVVPSQPLIHLQSKVAGALARAGHAGAKRKFLPHVTLAYLNGTPPDAAARLAASHNLFAFGPFPVREFHLYESHLGGDGGNYEILETYALSSSR